MYDAITQSPQWGRTVMVVNFDEHGGFRGLQRALTLAHAFEQATRFGDRRPPVVGYAESP